MQVSNPKRYTAGTTTNRMKNRMKIRKPIERHQHASDEKSDEKPDEKSDEQSIAQGLKVPFGLYIFVVKLDPVSVTGRFRVHNIIQLYRNQSIAISGSRKATL